LKVLFVGGTGIISSACAALALDRGIDLWLLRRGRSPRPADPRAHVLTADGRDGTSIARAVEGQTFDAVVQWVAFTPDEIERDVALFGKKTRQYLFISSASVYQTPPERVPVTEATPLSNPYWKYSRDKIACELALTAAARDRGFPMTIVRPSHTYDRTLLPPHGGWTVVDRMRRKAAIVVHGDGTSLWTLTHHADFARGLVGLLGLESALGEAFHVTSDEALTWDQIHHAIARAANTSARIVHVPSELIARYDTDWGASLLGDKAHSMIFDNTKIKRYVPDFSATTPFEQGAEEIVEWYDADPNRRVIDRAYEATVSRILAAYARALPD
jgi:nucleoside-diphosphate-sugar epimerase